MFQPKTKDSSSLKPDVILMNGVNPWQPASFVSPSTTLQSAGILPLAHGVLAISAAAGAGGITPLQTFIMTFMCFRLPLQQI